MKTKAVRKTKTAAEKAFIVKGVQALASASDVGALRKARDLLLEHVTGKVGKFRALAISCVGDVPDLVGAERP
jgi:hypothetical protein